MAIPDSTKTQHKIRLYGIDTPEKEQAFGNVAKKYTSKLVYGKTVDVILVAKGVITQEELMVKIVEIRTVTS